MNVLRTLWRSLTPPHFRSYVHHLRSHFDIIEIQSGNFRSLREQKAVDKHGEPLPWYTYPAIEFLKQLDFTNKDIFEYGTGNSTLFWSRRAKKVVSVESDEVWFDKVQAAALNTRNVSILYRSEKNAYVNEIKEHPGFDVIVIDGLHRLECARASAGALRDGGLIILDNSDVCPSSAQYLRQRDLIQVDMIGLGPGIAAIWATSLFFRRDFSMSSKSAAQPSCGRERAAFDD